MSLMPKQLLIADDSYLVRETIKNVFAGRTDIVVCGEASNGLEAVEKARTLKPDLVLLDLAMPEMNGAEAASVLENDGSRSSHHSLHDAQRKRRKLFDVCPWHRRGAVQA